MPHQHLTHGVPGGIKPMDLTSEEELNVIVIIIMKKLRSRMKMKKQIFSGRLRYFLAYVKASASSMSVTRNTPGLHKLDIHYIINWHYFSRA